MCAANQNPTNTRKRHASHAHNFEPLEARELLSINAPLAFSEVSATAVQKSASAIIGTRAVGARGDSPQLIELRNAVFENGVNDTIWFATDGTSATANARAAVSPDRKVTLRADLPGTAMLRSLTLVQPLSPAGILDVDVFAVLGDEQRQVGHFNGYVASREAYNIDLDPVYAYGIQIRWNCNADSWVAVEEASLYGFFDSIATENLITSATVYANYGPDVANVTDTIAGTLFGAGVIAAKADGVVVGMSLDKSVAPSEAVIRTAMGGVATFEFWASDSGPIRQASDLAHATFLDSETTEVEFGGLVRLNVPAVLSATEFAIIVRESTRFVAIEDVSIYGMPVGGSTACLQDILPKRLFAATDLTADGKSDSIWFQNDTVLADVGFGVFPALVERGTPSWRHALGDEIGGNRRDLISANLEDGSTWKTRFGSDGAVVTEGLEFLDLSDSELAALLHDVASSGLIDDVVDGIGDIIEDPLGVLKKQVEKVKQAVIERWPAAEEWIGKQIDEVVAFLSEKVDEGLKALGDLLKEWIHEFGEDLIKNLTAEEVATLAKVAGAANVSAAAVTDLLANLLSPPAGGTTVPGPTNPPVSPQPVARVQVIFQNGILTIAGTAHEDDILLEQRGNGAIELFVNARSAGRFRNVTLISVDLAAGNDRYVNNTAVPSVARGGDGTDWMMGGAAADELFGGDGDDVINGREGDDLLRGGRGNDRITGGAGFDRAYRDLHDQVVRGVELWIEA